MNFRQLEYVLAIYKEGNLTQAAAKLYISQPALTQQLQKLEKEIGAPLFDRSCTPMKPTYIGLRYLETVQKILFDNQQALKWIEDLNLYKTGKIIFGISGVRSLQFLPILLPEFKKLYPGIDISIREAPALSLPSMIEKGDIDFALMLAETDHTGLTFIPLLKERVLLAVPAEHPINAACQKSVEKQGYVDFSLCKDAPFILLNKGYRLHDLALSLFEESGIAPPVVLKTGNVDLSHHLTAYGYGLSLVGEMAALMTSFPTPPNYYPVPSAGSVWTLGIAYHPNKYVTKAMQAFFDFIKKEMKKLPLGK